MPDNNFESDEEIINLTELIESGANTAKTGGAAAYAKAASTIQEDNFKDYLSDLDMGETDDAPVDANEKLDMSGMGDIADLLDSFDIPAQPQNNRKEAEIPSPPPIQKEEPEAELDSLLDDLLSPGEDSAKRKQPEPPMVSEPLEDINADLNSILEEAGDLNPASEPPQKEVSPPVAEKDELDLDLVFPEEAPAAKEEPQFVMDAPVFGKNDLEAEIPLVAAAVSSGKEVGSGIEDNAKPITSFPVHQVSEYSHAPDTLANICASIIKAQGAGTEDALRDFSHKLGFQTARLEDMEKRIAELSSALQASARELQAAREKINFLEKDAESKSDLKALFEEGTALNKGFMAVLATGIANASQNLANSLENGLEPRLQQLEERLVPITENTEELQTRLMSLENSQVKNESGIDKIAEIDGKFEVLQAQFQPVSQALAEVDARMAGLEASQAHLGSGVCLSDEVMNRLGSLETQESGFLAKFASIEGRLDSIEAAAGEFNTNLNEADLADLQGSLQKIVQLEKSLNARMDALEKRLDALEPGFNEEIEKAAARTVAKILHEEIARLVAGN